MKIKFQADADLNENIVKGVLRKNPQIDFKTATEAGFEGLIDEAVLEDSSNEGRILVTHDRKTMPFHFAEFIKVKRCSGVLIVPKNAEISRVIEDLLLIWAASDAEEYNNSIRTIPL